VSVVEVERVAERAVQQRGDRRCPGLAVADDRGVAVVIEAERLQHAEQRGRRFRLAPCPHRAAEKIQRQVFGSFQHLARNRVIGEVGDIGGELCGFVGHGLVLRNQRGKLGRGGRVFK